MPFRVTTHGMIPALPLVCALVLAFLLDKNLISFRFYQPLTKQHGGADQVRRFREPEGQVRRK